MINVPYRLARIRARLTRAVFSTFIASACKPVTRSTSQPGHLFTFSGMRDFPEQVASLRSFLRWAGTPERITIVSDGTHDDRSKSLLRQLHPRLDIRDYSEFLSGAPPRLKSYANQHPLGKKLAVLRGFPVDGPTIYADSDILFFPGAAELGTLLLHVNASPRYLLDCWPSLDESLLKSDEEKARPLNSGFLIFQRQIDWSEAVGRMESTQSSPGFFTEQTAVHLAFRAAGAEPLPAERYIMLNDDQWGYGDSHASRPIVMRHYISSFRHKMWLQVPLFRAS